MHTGPLAQFLDDVHAVFPLEEFRQSMPDFTGTHSITRKPVADGRAHALCVNVWFRGKCWEIVLDPMVYTMPLRSDLVRFRVEIEQRIASAYLSNQKAFTACPSGEKPPA